LLWWNLKDQGMELCFTLRIHSRVEPDRRQEQHLESVISDGDSDFSNVTKGRLGLMEWYAITMCNGSIHAASFFGAIQLIIVAAIWIFDVALPKPEKE